MILKCREKRKQMEKTDIISRTRTFEQPLPGLRERDAHTSYLRTRTPKPLAPKKEHADPLQLKKIN